MKALPSGSEFVHEAIVLIGGALLAAWVLSQLPEVRAYIQANTRGIGAGCDCNG